jgi:hypothetical protein
MNVSYTASSPQFTVREDPMAYALTHHFGTAVAARQPPSRAGDSLDTMRGIIASALVSVLLFWLPLVFLLTR